LLLSSREIAWLSVQKTIKKNGFEIQIRKIDKVNVESSFENKQSGEFIFIVLFY
jgi:hypothetical protein